MKFIIEVSDFYLDEEQDLESALKKHLIYEITKQINDAIKQKVEDGVTKEVKAQVEQSLYRKIAKLTEDVIASDKVKGRYSNSPELTLTEYIKELFVQTARDKAPVDATIQKLANAFGEELKKRYDLLFASQLVAKMKESGFIKEEVIALLLDNKPA